METYEIIVAGNGEPALVCTLSARNTYTDKSIAIIKNDRKNSIIEEILSSASNGFNKRLNIFYDEIDSKNHNVLNLASGDKLKYEKLVLATGSCAIEPPIDGIKKDGVFLINRDPKNLKKISW